LPRSRLLLMGPHGRHRQRLRERMQSFGVAGDRLDFVAYRPRREYLQTYHTIDLGLDTLPYNGHTTSLDSFWMGVPVVSRIGQTCVGRGGLSQLHQLGLLELAADSDAAFVDTAVRWGRDWPGLAALRHRLRPRMQACALMDGARFARHMEAAYRLAFEDRGARAL
jgi:predicted O-linked N-acetylglucosamine transferase (SPINDLY family)